MAKVEFYKITIRDKVSGEKLETEILKSIKDKLEDLSDKDKYCVNRTCSAILSEYHDNGESVTFDFSKFTDEIINSTIISKPLNDTNTFEELNKKIIETITYTDDDEIQVLKLVDAYKGHALMDKLIENNIEDFKIYKILKQNISRIEEKELKEFYAKTLHRMKKEKIFFNIVLTPHGFVLLFQKATHGFDVNHLSEYLNTHLFLAENFKVFFHKIYDSPFIDILENSELSNFKFSFSGKEKSLLDKNEFSQPFTALLKNLGNNLITISAKAEDNNPLDNKKLLQFFEIASEAGILEDCSVKAKRNPSYVHSKDKGVELNYSKNIKIETIMQADDFFKDAYEEKQHTIALKLKG